MMGVKQWFRPEEQQAQTRQTDGELGGYHPRRFDDLREKVFDPEYQAKLQAEEEEALRKEQWAQMPELPIPQSMLEIFRNAQDPDGEGYELRGQLVCGCGSTRWRVKESNHRQMVKVVCRECGASYIAYDAGRMGWHALLTGRDFIERREPWQDVGCIDCDGDTFHVRISLTNLGRKPFLDALNSQDVSRKEGHLLRERLRPEDWVNAFDWFRMDLTCHRTGHQQIGWLETERVKESPSEEADDQS